MVNLGKVASAPEQGARCTWADWPEHLGRVGQEAEGGCRMLPLSSVKADRPLQWESKKLFNSNYDYPWKTLKNVITNYVWDFLIRRANKSTGMATIQKSKQWIEQYILAFLNFPVNMC